MEIWFKQSQATLLKVFGLIAVFSIAHANESAREVDLWHSLMTDEVRDIPAFQLPKRNERLPNVLLFGDSISSDYFPFVAQALRGKVNLYRMPPKSDWDSSTFVPYLTELTSTMAPAWEFKWDVIHFNFGLHDMKRYNTLGKKDTVNGSMQVGYNDYAQNLTKSLQWLKTNSPDTKLIFATTTPVPVGEPRRRTADSIGLNDLAREILADSPDISINDLYSFTLARHEEWQLKPHNVHYNESGSRAQGEAVARAILQALSGLN